MNRPSPLPDPVFFSIFKPCFGSQERLEFHIPQFESRLAPWYMIAVASIFLIIFQVNGLIRKTLIHFSSDPVSFLTQIQCIYTIFTLLHYSNIYPTQSSTFDPCFLSIYVPMYLVPCLTGTRRQLCQYRLLVLVLSDRMLAELTVCTLHDPVFPQH